MANENGEWIMRGLDWNSPYRIRTWQELINWINEVGFLPLFANEVEGFSAEEHISPDYWWTGKDETGIPGALQDAYRTDRSLRGLREWNY